MIIIVLGKPLAFWIGILAFFSLSLQIYLGMKMAKGHPELLKYHRLNAIILFSVVVVHLLLVLALYYL